MSKIYLARDLMKVVSQGEIPPNCDRTLNLRIVTAKNGSANAVWKVDEGFLNGIGVVMGGFISSAADITMAYAISSLLREDQSFSSINLHTTFHRPVVAGNVEVEARVEKMGKTIAYLVSDLQQNEKVVATAVSSIIILEVEKGE